MTDAQVLDILSGGFEIAAKVAGPVLIAALVIGVVISILQTITQVQEMTLTFVPKLVGAALIVLVSGNWMMRELLQWVRELWDIIPGV